MFDNDQFDHDNQFVVSYELLALLVWLIEHEDEELSKLVKKAFASGLKDTLPTKATLSDPDLLEEAQQTIIDFFGIMESHMLEAMHEQSIKKALEKKLLPAIDQIDTAICDDETVRLSIERATSIPENAKETPKEALCRELLRNWKPQKNQAIN